ncbi:Phosphatidylinositol-4-phosphate 5-kinase [Cryptosporidium parvum]|nr:Phosphatidylinositol-4-phosphate 5-kinase [Cryptosporidium parvum]WRK34090.1 Phosphatidylinositol-4-phosphate 5-kinase [Cryptosporidium parvum]|eukprot:QOY40092.1 hypothetical protein CPATCC_004171 [Cryptosporidium parvum]
MHKIKIFFRKCSSFKLKQDIFTKIQNETNLSTKQIRDFYNTFISNSDNGFMDIRRFRIVLGLLDDGLLSQMIFNAMDTDNNNLLDFYEFGRALAIMISDNFDEKARFSYRVIKGENYMNLSDGITFEKLLKSIRAIDSARYMLVGPQILNFSDQEIKNFFNDYSTVKDEQNEPKIYFESYKAAIQDSPEFLSFFGIITPNILESYDLDIENRKSPLIFEGINIFNRQPIDRVEYNESIEKEFTSRLKLQVFNILEDIKNIKQETTDSLNTLEKWIRSPNENNLLNCMLFDINKSTNMFEAQNFTDTNSIVKIFTHDMLLLKSVLNNNIEMLDSICKKSIYSLQNMVPPSQIVTYNNFNLGIIKKVYNRRKMYINKGNVAPNTKHRMSASEMIKKTFMHKSSSTLDYTRNSYCSNNRKRVSLIHTYRRRSNISRGFQNMAKTSSKIKVKGSRANVSSIKSKHSHSEKETPTISGINVPVVKITKGYAVYIGHESWNTVLNMMVGMRLAIGRVYSEPNRDVADYDFIMKEKFFIIPRTSRESNTKSNVLIQKSNDYRGFMKPVQFIDYNPMVFRKIREICNISPESYVRSVGPEQLLGNMVLGNLSSMNELCSEGKSGAFFYYTTDGRFLIKTVGKKTAVFFRSILSKYFNHIKSNQNSLITRIYGLHALRFKKPLLQPFNTIREQISSNGNSILRKSKIHKIFFIVMENIFHTPVEIHRRYDIKGSWIGRSTPLILQEDKTIALKELDMKNNKEMLHINQQDQIDLLKQLEVDCKFFELYNIMDYSLLIGIHYVQDDAMNIKSLIENKNNRKFVGILSSDQKKVYYLGFIDFFSTWSTIKKFERLYKAIIIGSSNGISAVPPDKYSMRFMKFIKSKISE